MESEHRDFSPGVWTRNSRTQGCNHSTYYLSFLWLWRDTFHVLCWHVTFIMLMSFQAFNLGRLTFERRNKFYSLLFSLGYFAVLQWFIQLFILLPAPLLRVRRERTNIHYRHGFTLQISILLHSTKCLTHSLQLFEGLGCFGSEGSWTPTEPAWVEASLMHHSVPMASNFLFLCDPLRGYQGNQNQSSHCGAV